ncbi:MAG: ATP-binding protein, partial [Cyanobacteriota bacterium]
MVADLSLAPIAADRGSASLACFALAAIAARLDWDGLAGDMAPELVFLQHQLRQLGARRLVAGDLAASIRNPVAEDRPLVALADQLGLSALELLTVALAIAAEEQALVGRVLAHVQRPLGGSRPSLGLLASAFAELSGEPHPLHRLLSGPAFGCGLLQLQNGTGPLPEQTLSLPSHLVLALRGFDALPAGTSIGLRQGLSVPLPPSLLAAVQRQAQGLQGGRVLVVRTGCLPEGQAVTAALAAALGCRPLFLTGEMPTGLGPWLLLRQLLPVFCRDLAPGERRQLPEIPGYGGPVLALC